MRSVKAAAWRHGKLGRAMLPVYLVCAGLIIALAVANLAHAEPLQLQTDERGFLNTAARCDKPQFAVAVGRTQQSLVAICVDGRGHYQYHGMKLKDNSVLNVPARATADGKFIVENADFTYTFSAKELVIASGDRVLRKEPMVAYIEPRLPS
jgi:hypothetical protein